MGQEREDGRVGFGETGSHLSATSSMTMYLLSLPHAHTPSHRYPLHLFAFTPVCGLASFIQEECGALRVAMEKASKRAGQTTCELGVVCGAERESGSD